MKTASSRFSDGSQASENKIMELAIHHKSKPGLALSVVEFAERNEGKTIPQLFQNIFSRLVGMAKTRG